MNASAKAEYQRQRKEERVRRGYEYLAPRDPIRANALLLTNQQQWASEYRDHEIPQLPSRPGTSNHVSETTIQKESPMNALNQVEYNNPNAHIIHTFASTSGNLEIIRTSCHQIEGWSKVGEGHMLNGKTNKNVKWVEIQSPKGKIFRIAFDIHPKHKTPCPVVWENVNGKLYRKNLYDGKDGAARSFLRRKFTTANPNSPWFSLHGAHHLVIKALLLQGHTLNIVTEREDITTKILCS